MVSIRFSEAGADRALSAYRPDRIEWHYVSTPSSIAALKARTTARFVGGAINANPPLTDPAGFARDLDGQIVVAPWMTWGARYVTTASPGTRAALLDWARRTLAAGADAVQVDDGWFQLASEGWGSGDFSQASLAGFGPWLARNVPAAELKSLGIPAGPAFDYRAWLRSRYHVRSAADYRRRRGTLPTTGLWRRYLASEVFEFWAELRAAVPAPLSMNFGAVIPDEGFVGLADRVDYTASELLVEDEAWKLQLYGATAEAAGLPFVGCFTGRASPARLRQMIAGAYASGIVPAAPWDMWVPSEAGVTQPRFSPDPAQFTDLYDFVRGNRRLFDGWTSAGKIGVLVPARAYDGHLVAALVKRLVAENVPFRILLADSAYRTLRPGPRELEGLSAVILAQSADAYSAETLAAVRHLRREIDPAQQAVGRLADPDWRLAARRKGHARLLHLVPARFGAAPFSGQVVLAGKHGAMRLLRPAVGTMLLTPAESSTNHTVYALPAVRDWAILEAQG